MNPNAHFREAWKRVDATINPQTYERRVKARLIHLLEHEGLSPQKARWAAERFWKAGVVIG